jgi:hypothetical protein
MLVMYLCVRAINVSHVFVCSVCKCWSCICVFGLLRMTVISLIDVVFVDILYNFVEGWICSTEITSRRML